MDNQSLYLLFLIVLIVWSLSWKGAAMWRAARNGQIAWFVAILIISLVGLLEITYLMFFQRKKENSI